MTCSLLVCTTSFTESFALKQPSTGMFLSPGTLSSYVGASSLTFLRNLMGITETSALVSSLNFASSEIPATHTSLFQTWSKSHELLLSFTAPINSLLQKANQQPHFSWLTFLVFDLPTLAKWLWPLHFLHALPIADQLPLVWVV